MPDKLYVDLRMIDTQEISVTRGEYRFLLMEYARLGMELAEYKKALEETKRILYAALKDWSLYNVMGAAPEAMLNKLRKEFEPETEEEGSLTE